MRWLRAVAVLAVLAGCAVRNGQPPGDACAPQELTWVYALSTDARRLDIFRRSGGDERRLTRGGLSSDPALSPDGSRIVFSRGLGGYSDGNGFEGAQLHVMDLDGGGQRPFLDGSLGSFDTMPAWSPDGSSIAFLRTDFGRGGSRLMVVPAAGGEPRQVPGAAPVLTNVPAWSADGTRLAWVESSPGGPTTIGWSTVDGAERGSLPVSGWVDDGPVWTADGDGFILSLSGPVGAPTDPFRLHRMDRRTGALTPLDLTGRAFALTRLPTGQLAAFVRAGSESRQASLVVTDERGQQPVTVADVEISFPYNGITLGAIPDAADGWRVCLTPPALPESSPTPSESVSPNRPGTSPPGISPPGASPRLSSSGASPSG